MMDETRKANETLTWKAQMFGISPTDWFSVFAKDQGKIKEEIGILLYSYEI